MTDRGAEADAIEEVDQFCEIFDGTADPIAQETGGAANAAALATDGEEAQG